MILLLVFIFILPVSFPRALPPSFLHFCALGDNFGELGDIYSPSYTIKNAMINSLRKRVSKNEIEARKDKIFLKNNVIMNFYP